MRTCLPDCRAAWEDSYAKRQNFLFHPTEELVRFVARHLRRRVGLDEMVDVHPGAAGMRFLDVGCGIGRHLVFGHEMGFDVYGLDLSSLAVDLARTWLGSQGIPDADRRVRQSDVRAMPWPDGFFQVVVSHGTFDSMPLEVAEAGIRELHRVTAPDALFYCDLICGDARQEVVQIAHEENTIQSYFDEEKINRLLQGRFDCLERVLVERWSDAGPPARRWHLTLRRA
ncbi:methyltransferase domain-containing protein [Azospirillum palustre]